MATNGFSNLAPGAQLVLTTLLGDASTWDYTNAIQASEDELRVVARTSDAEIDAALAFLRAKLIDGVASAKEEVEALD